MKKPRKKSVSKAFLIFIGEALPRWCDVERRPTKKYFLPFGERRRLHERALRAQAKDQLEVCGVMSADARGRIRLQFLANNSPKSLHFVLRERDIRAARKDAHLSGYDVIGLFHSHPVSSAIPTRTDLRSFRANTVNLIYDVCGREPRLWRVAKKRGRTVALQVPLILGRRGA